MSGQDSEPTRQGRTARNGRGMLDLSRGTALATPFPKSELRRAVAALSLPPPSGRATTSDLSIDEVLLLHSVDWEPVDLVFGTSWWSVPWGSWQWQVGEIAQAASAFSGAFSEAAAQLRQECARVGGLGVVGVDMQLRVASHHVDVALNGTAVRRPKAPPTQSPFVSDLSARDFALLCRSGWAPIGLVAGGSFVVAPRRSVRQWASQQTQNLELPNLTEAVYLAREKAMARMQRGGLDIGAAGVVNVKLREGPLGRGARMMQFVAVGTAVVPEGDQRSIMPSMVVPLDEPERLFEAASLRRKGRAGS